MNTAPRTIVPFEATHGTRPTYSEKDKAFNYIISLANDCEFIRRACIVIARNKDGAKAEDVPELQYIESTERTIKSLLHIMELRLNSAMKGLSSETRFFILGLQMKQEFEEIERKFTPGFIGTVIDSYNNIPFMVNKIAASISKGEIVSVPTSHFDKIVTDEDSLQVLVEGLRSIGEEYKQALNSILDGRLDELFDGAKYRGISFSLIPAQEFDDRIELAPNEKLFVEACFGLLALDKKGNASDEHMMSPTDIDYFLQANFFDFGEKLPRKHLITTITKSYLKYFVYKIYEAVSNRSSDLKLYRQLLPLNFIDFKDILPKTLEDTFKREPAGFPAFMKRAISDYKKQYLK